MWKIMSLNAHKTNFSVEKLRVWLRCSTAVCGKTDRNIESACYASLQAFRSFHHDHFIGHI